MITDLNYKYDRERLKKEANYVSSNSIPFVTRHPSYIPEKYSATEDFDQWIKTFDIGTYGKTIVSYFENLLGCEVRPRYYIQEKNFALPFHKDRGTRCCINFVLSGSDDPIEFRSFVHSYKCALINVQEEHKVTTSVKDRILFKLSVDIDYDEALKKLHRLV
tara:strand:+ start:717 stop:1202 length:486 start_codon:yes stop_codon:yes gene_type:complete